MNFETIGIIASIAGAILGLIGLLLYLRQRGQRHSTEANASGRSAAAGRDVSGQVATGDQSNVAGVAGVQSSGPTTVYQGLQAVDHDLLVRIHESLGELKEGLLAPRQGAASPDTEALAAQATDETERLLDEAVDLQRQHKEREAIDCLLEAYRRDLPPLAKSQLHLLAGNGFSRLSDLQEAEGHYHQALGAARDGQDKQAEAAALGNLGLVYAACGEMDKAEEHLRRSLALHEEIGNKLGQARQLGNLGTLYKRRGDLDKAEEHCRQALALHEEVGNKLGQANQLGNLGNVYLRRGEPDKAEGHYRRALALFEEIGNKLGQAQVMGNLGAVYAGRGDLDKAEEHYRRALALDEQIGNKLGQAQDLGNLGDVCMQRGDLDKAEEHFRRALALHDKTGYKLGQATQIGNWGLIEEKRGKATAARELLGQAAALYKEIGAGGENPETAAAALKRLDAAQ